jgi:hypothetical protein
MENNSAAAFAEKQYIGRDYVRISARLVMALFCFVAYFVTEERERDTANVFLIVGCSILLVSVVMMFLPHYKTTVQNKSMVLSGLWTTRLVKINLGSIVQVEQVPYDGTYLINNPVYNLHKKGTIWFYAGGKHAVKLTDCDGLIYVVGTQFPVELERKIKVEMEKI